jgi:SAM-dependent methyltransferase
MIETLLRERARSGARVLDLGCGDAELTRRLAELGYEAVGLDADRPRLLAARQLSATASSGRPPLLVCGDAGRLPLRVAAFDAAASHSVFEHLPDPPAAFREARRVLRTGGFLFVNVPHRWGPREGHVPAWFAHWLPAGPLRRAWLTLLGKDGRKWDAYIRGIHYWTPGGLRREMSRAFERAEIVSLRRYERADELTTGGQRRILSLLRRPATAWLGRILVRAMGHIDGLGVAGARAPRGGA